MASARGSLERELLADTADGQLDQFSLLAAALTASGCEDRAAAKETESRFALAVAAGLAELQLERDEALRAIGALRLLHRCVLRGAYHPDGDDLQVAIDGGRFNCVSATLLYQTLAESLGLKVTPIVMPGHVAARVQLADHELLVDPTSIHGHEHLWSANVNEPRHRDVRRLSRVQLVALVYYNRAVDELARRNYAPAYEAGMKANWLDGQHRAARTNLVATLNNWAIDRLQARRWDDAEALLRRGLQIASDEPTLQHNLLLLESRRKQLEM